MEVKEKMKEKEITLGKLKSKVSHFL